MRLTSRAFLDTPSGERPHVKLAALEQAAGLVVLTGGPGGPLDLAFAAGQAELAAARCERLTRLFGDRLYVELQRHALPEENSSSRRCSISPTPRACRSLPPTSRTIRGVRISRRMTR